MAVAVFYTSQRTARDPNESSPVFLGRDVSIVEIATKNNCERYKAYVYDGPSDLTRTTVAWVDDSHLLIKYHPDDANRYQRCENEPPMWSSLVFL